MIAPGGQTAHDPKGNNDGKAARNFKLTHDR